MIPPPIPRRRLSDGRLWALISGILALVLVIVVWLVVIDAPVISFVVRLYRDKQFLKETVRSWGWMAPLVFILIQALQVVIAPIPGEVTGPVGGALFGTTWGLVYSTIGLTIGTLICFGLGRAWGEPIVRPWLSEHHWNRMNFIIGHETAKPRVFDGLRARIAQALTNANNFSHRLGDNARSAAILAAAAQPRAASCHNIVFGFHPPLGTRIRRLNQMGAETPWSGHRDSSSWIIAAVALVVLAVVVLLALP